MIVKLKCRMCGEDYEHHTRISQKPKKEFCDSCLYEKKKQNSAEYRKRKERSVL